MEYQNILTSIKEGILTLTINREPKLNALNLQTMKEIGAVFEEVRQNEAVKAVIVTGAGAKAFVAGADISEIAQLSKEEGARFAAAGQSIFASIEQCPKPVIAAVNGFALGGGCELAMACHIRVAAENAKFGLPEVSLGILPGYGGTQRLPKLVGRGKAIEMMCTGDMMGAAEAKEWGLANHVVPAEELIAFCEAMLKKMMQKAPLAIAKVIASVNALDEVANGYAFEAEVFGECCLTQDFKEGTSAFLEKRKANFQGK
jgi:enoyl-CoA hydratase